MKKSLAFIFFLHCGSYAFAQPMAEPVINRALEGTGNTYAVVIGISSYKDRDIPPLAFSHRDASVFTDFLMSAPGGSVPRQNIKLLTDSMATTDNVAKSLRWLVANCKEGDKVFFYFSGHGEIEDLKSKNGYLICYNSPSVAFTLMGLSIDYLNKVVNKLSVDTKATVVVITDACHSGSMNGNNFEGNYFIGEQLMLKKENEIRIASSKPDQLSNEKEDWGGGRGVFSYYLVNGLQGESADKNQDGLVSVGELKHYLENGMANDPVLKLEQVVQTPLISGTPDFALAKVVKSEAIKVEAQFQQDLAANFMVLAAAGAQAQNKDDNAEPAEYFFNFLQKQHLEGLTDSLNLSEAAADKIAFALINRFKKDSLTSGAGLQKLNELETYLQTDKEQLNRFNVDLAGSFLDIGQDVITNYIKGDEAELERRRYYNSKNNGYDVYTRMFAVALKLSETDKYYSTKAEVFLHYFTGLALRLKIPLVSDPAPLIEQALAAQNKALALEEHAAYIYNELGVLYKLKKSYSKAEKYYLLAIGLSPQWAIPQSNLCAIYSALGKFEKALAACKTADSLQSGVQSVAINTGLIFERKGNLLVAEEYYHKAIEINSRHFFPFERLGFVNMQTTSYAAADSFFYEAEQRKKGYHFLAAQDTEGDGVVDQFDVDPPFPPFSFDTLLIKKTDIFAFFYWAMQEYEIKKHPDAAIRIFKKVIDVDKTNPLVFHYLGKLYFEQKKWEEAEIYFKLALTFSKNKDEFATYVDSVKKSVIYPYPHTYFENYFEARYYGQIEDHYFIATVYERWKHLEEAETYFKRIIQIDSLAVDGYYKLWNLYETQGLFIQAEELIQKYTAFNDSLGIRELNAFYRRMTVRFPDDGILYYKLGLLQYSLAQTLKEPLDFESYRSWYSTDSVQQGIGKNIPGTNEEFFLANNISFPAEAAIVYFKRAAELLAEKETLADVNFKTGSIYLRSGAPKEAYSWFEKSLKFQPDNANTRLALVDIYAALYKNTAALQQLNILHDSALINFDKRMLLANFDIRAGNFDKASAVLNKAELIYPYVLPMASNLRGLSNMLDGKATAAIDSYKKSILQQQGDPWFTNYSLARLYAREGNTKEAWSYLQFAIKAGFNFSYVLQNDSYIESLRNTVKWKTTISGIAMKKYKKTSP